MSRIGYVLKVYPRFSETFIVTEILAREALGDDLRIFALRPTTDTRFHPEIARVKAPVVWVPRPLKICEMWELFSDALAGRETAERFARILPDLATLPGDEVAQGVALARAALEEGITHLHAHFASLAGRLAWIASRLTGIPFTVTTHAKDIYHESVDIDWLRRLGRDADRIIAISRFNEEHLRSVLAGTGARISLRYNALELARFDYREPAAPTIPLRIASVGRLVEKKGFADLIDAARILIDSGVPCTVGIAGEGELRADLQARIDVRGLSEAVTLLGPLNQEEVRALFASAHVFAAPCIIGADGNIDGLPTVVLEAMACGTPVVATSVSALPEVVRPDTGVLVPPASPRELAGALARFADGRVDARDLSRGARRLIEEEFDSLVQAEVLSQWERDEGRGD